MLKLFAATLLATTPLAVWAQAARPAAADDGLRVPTRVFGKLPNMRGVTISPDGNKLAYMLGANGTTQLVVLDLTQPNPKPKLVAASGEFREIGDRTVGYWNFVGNDHVVYQLASREDVFGSRADVTRLVSHNIATGKNIPLAWDGATAAADDILDADYDKGSIVLARMANRSGTERMFRPEVVRVDVATGKFEMVLRPNPVVSGWVADRTGVVRGGFGGDSDTGEERILYRSREGENFRTVIRQKDKDFTGAGIRPVMVEPGSDMAYVSSNKDGFAKIYKTDMRTLELGKPVFEVAGYDAGGPILSRDQSRIVGWSAVEKRPTRYWIDPTYKEIQAFLDEGFGKGNAIIVQSDMAAKRFLINVAAPNQPSAAYLYDTGTGDFKLIGWSDNQLKDRKMNPVSSFRYRASDGVEIEAVLTMPRHRKGKNLPVVMITHGGPFGVRDYERFDDWGQAMAELGYVVVQPNYRGSGGYGAEFIKKGRSDGFGLRMQDDLNDAITHLAAQGVVDPKRACMMGWSYGGYASARAAQRDPDKWRCTIAGAGVYDLPAMKTYDVNYLGTFGSNYLAKGAADLRSVSPTHNARGRWSPILIVHGVRDQRVPINQARGLVSALRSAGKKQGVDFDYIEQPKNTHHLPYDDVSIEWLEGAERWLAKHNPAYLPSDADKPVPVSTTLASK